MKTMKSNVRMALLVGATVFSAGAHATPSVKIDSVQQRWPWNNKADITYTVTDGQDVSSGVYQRLVFTATIDGTAYTIDGTKDVGASASSGTHTVAWTLPSGKKASDCTMVAALYASENPSGDDYMVVDLASGEVTYEGLLASQEASNARYNVPLYKTDKMVLRKVAAGGTYPTGYTRTDLGGNTRHSWTTDRDFYIGVFMVTQAQYQKIYGSNPSNFKTDVEGNLAAHRPVECVSWEQLRGSSAPLPADVIVAKSDGSFFERLAALTGVTGFDLPTEVMGEISSRAGGNNQFFWGLESTPGVDYCIYSGNSGSKTVAVGTKLPNGWGLYDVQGNAYELRLDDGSLSDLANAPDPWTPASGGNDNRRIRGGCDWSAAITHKDFVASARNSTGKSNRMSVIGFRAARVMPK